MSKILLIAAPRPDSNETAMHMGDGRPPMGLAYISAYLEQFGHQTQIIDLYHFGGGHDDEKQKATKASATISHIIKNLVTAYVVTLFFGCENNFSDVKKVGILQNQPIGEAENIDLKSELTNSSKKFTL